MNTGKRRMRHAVAVTGAAVAASLVIGGSAPPADGRDDARAQAPTAGGRTVRVEANLRVGEELDLGAPGRSAGDQFVFGGDLLSAGEREDRTVGRIGGFCVITDPGRNAGECSMTAVLEEGQIAVQGEQVGVPAPVPVANAITGGTGEFRNAHGQVALRVLTPATWELVFRLTGR